MNFGAGLSTNYYNVSGRENGNFGAQLRDNFSQYIGLSLSIPIFNRFSTRNQVRSARIQQSNLNWQLEESKKTLYKEIQQAYYNALGAESKLQSSRTADEAAEASFLLMKEKYANGKANATEYNEARTYIKNSNLGDVKPSATHERNIAKDGYDFDETKSILDRAFSKKGGVK